MKLFICIFIVFASILLELIHSQSCIYASLNLEPLSNTPITCNWEESDGMYQILYQSCGDQRTCTCTDCTLNGNNFLAMQNEVTPNGTALICYILALNSDNPLISNIEIDGISGTRLEYLNGQTCWEGPQRKTQLNFLCGNTLYDENRTTCGEFEPCVYSMNIYTNLACEPCLYRTNDAILDLRSIGGMAFGKSSDISPNTYLYGFTPCSNSLSCLNNTSIVKELVSKGKMDIKQRNVTNKYNNKYNAFDVQAFREEIGGLQCDKVLAMYDVNVQPLYDTSSGVFQFVYNEPNQCGSIPSTTFVYYNCNPAIATANITSARELSECIYEIDIDSVLACQNQSPKVKDIYLNNY